MTVAEKIQLKILTDISLRELEKNDYKIYILSSLCATAANSNFTLCLLFLNQTTEEHGRNKLDFYTVLTASCVVFALCANNIGLVNFWKSTQRILEFEFSFSSMGSSAISCIDQ